MLAFVVGALTGLAACLLALLLLRGTLQRRADARFEAERAAQVAEETRMAVRHSESVLRGQVFEHLLPVLDGGSFASPADARFLGRPVDFIVFDGYSEVQAGLLPRLREIVFVDVKTGRAQLSSLERRIRDCVDAGRVRTVVLEHPAGWAGHRQP
jgi:predicted Holliday junction resolvase-like endonuclease